MVNVAVLIHAENRLVRIASRDGFRRQLFIQCCGSEMVGRVRLNITPK